MEEILMKEGFIKSDNPGEYTRGTWTIRLDEYMIEVFDNVDYASSKYYSSDYTFENLENILSELSYLQ